MSHRATNWAIQQRGLNPATKILLWYLADCHNNHTGRCDPSQDRLASECEMSRSSVNRHLTKLEEVGLIRRRQRLHDTSKKQLSTFYELAIDGPFSMSQSGTSPVCQNEQEPCVNLDDSRVSQLWDTNQEGEPGIEPGSIKNTKKETDLFSEESLPSQQDQTSQQSLETRKQNEALFEEWWKEIWPSHQRKTGKADCKALYLKSVEGRNPKADPITAAELNAATRRYIASVRDMQFLKGPLPWLRLPGWEPFMGAPEPKEPSRYQQIIAANAGLK